MTKTSMTLLAFACALALSACGGQAEGEHAEEAGHGSSSAGLPSGNFEAGKALASKKGAATGQACVDCHGADGNSPIDETYPKLGGQYADYLAHSLQQYRSGAREHALMSQQAKELSDQQIADLAVFFGSRPSQLRDLHGTH